MHCHPAGMKVDEPTCHILGQEYRNMNLSLSYSGIFLVYSQQNLSTTNWNYLFSVLTNHVAKLEWEPELCILVYPVNSYSYVFTKKAWKKSPSTKIQSTLEPPWKISPCGETHSSASSFRGCWIPHPLGLRFSHSRGSWFSISVAWNICTTSLQISL